MYLVYEKNYLNYSDIDCVEEVDMKLWFDKNHAILDMCERRDKYITDKENNFTFMENESTDTCLVFADELQKDKSRTGEFHICLTKLRVNDM